VKAVRVHLVDQKWPEASVVVRYASVRGRLVLKVTRAFLTGSPVAELSHRALDGALVVRLSRQALCAKAKMQQEN